MKIEEYVDSNDYSTMQIGGQFKYFTKIENVDDVLEAILFSKKKEISVFILGSGSNTIFSDGVINVLALKMEIKGFEIIKEDSDNVYIKAGAGVIWDDFVQESIENNFSGVESLSIIPGTVGAGPVQNVGAYGVEIKDILEEVIVYDTKDNKIKNLSNNECEFSYRDSIFKKQKGRYIILYVIYKLHKDSPKIPSYPDVSKYFIDNKIINPNLRQIREAIIHIRNSKLPDYRVTPNAGSFFKNPIVDNNLVERIKIDFPDIKIFPIDEYTSKVPAGWLIEKAGLKGVSLKNISVYEKNALVLVNNGNATNDDLIISRDEIINKVEKMFGIILEQEPEII